MPFKTLSLRGKCLTLLSAFAFSAAVSADSADALTLATAEVSGDLTHEIISGGSSLSISGDYLGDITNVGDTSFVWPGLEFTYAASGSTSLGGGLSGSVGETIPLGAGSVDDVTGFIVAIFATIDTNLSSITGGLLPDGTLTDFLAYAAGNSGATVPVPGTGGNATVAFSYVAADTGPDVFSGTYDFDLNTNSNIGTLGDIFGAQFLNQNFTAEFDVSASLAAVPLPATLPLLAFGGLGLALASRRRRSGSHA